MLLQRLPPGTPTRPIPERPSLPPPTVTTTTSTLWPSPLVTCSARVGDDFHSTLGVLNSNGRRTSPRRSLGQHYMLNPEVNEQLVNVAGVEEGDVVLEIGPGTGSLTNVLLAAGATVVAVEKDPNMALLVKERFEGEDRLVVLHEDITKCHIHAQLCPLLKKTKSTRAKVVSNLPFNISTDVVKQLLPMGDIISDIGLLLQDEAALRLVDATLGTPEYRPINIFVNFYSNPEYKFKVLRANFFPQPNVDGAVVKFMLKQAEDYPNVTSTKSFFSLVNSAFNGKRKMLRRSLRHICTSLEIEQALKSSGLPMTASGAESGRFCETAQFNCKVMTYLACINDLFSPQTIASAARVANLVGESCKEEEFRWPSDRTMNLKHVRKISSGASKGTHFEASS